MGTTSNILAVHRDGSTRSTLSRPSSFAFAGLLLSLAITHTATASIISLPQGDHIAFAGVADRGSFSEQFAFNLSSDSLVDGIFLTSLTNKVSLSFKAVADSAWTTIQSGITPNSATNFSLSGTPLHSGDYLFQIAGIGLGSFNSSRAFVGTLAVAPVPEPEIWAMLAIGTMLITYQLRRRSRSLMASMPALS